MLIWNVDLRRVRWEKKSNFALIVEIHMWLELTWKDLFHTFFFSEFRAPRQLSRWAVGSSPSFPLFPLQVIM